jgi:hypothetical protein
MALNVDHVLPLVFTRKETGNGKYGRIAIHGSDFPTNPVPTVTVKIPLGPDKFIHFDLVGKVVVHSPQLMFVTVKRRESDSLVVGGKGQEDFSQTGDIIVTVDGNSFTLSGQIAYVDDVPT